MVEIHPHDKDAAIKVAVTASISLTIMLSEFLWLIRDEIKYVWPRLRSSWRARFYLLARYIGFGSQIFNVYFTLRMYFGVSTSTSGCRIWFAYQAVIIQFLLLFVEVLLMHRLYALFLHNPVILVMLIAFGSGQVASMGVSAYLSFPSNKHTVTCMIVRSNPGNAFFSATTMTTNMIIFFMTFWRHFRLPEKWTHGVGRVVFRDSALSLGAITLMMLFLTLCSLQVIKPSTAGNITYYWFVTILWISIGRIIVNHEKIPQGDGSQADGDTWKGTLQLTSQIEMGEVGRSTLSVDTQDASSDGHAPASATLQTSLSTPQTKASQLSPLSVCPSDSSRKWLGSRTPPYAQGDRRSSQPSSAELSMEVSIRRISRTNVYLGDGDASQTEDRSQTDTDTDGRSHSRPPSPSLSTPPPSTRSSEALPSSEAPSSS